MDFFFSPVARFFVLLNRATNKTKSIRQKLASVSLRSTGDGPNAGLAGFYPMGRRTPTTASLENQGISRVIHRVEFLRRPPLQKGESSATFVKVILKKIVQCIGR